MPYAVPDTYKISVDARGTRDAAVPRLRQHPARARRSDQTVPGGVSVTRIQYLFFHECYGELGRMVSVLDEPNESFTNAAEFRRLAL